MEVRKLGGKGTEKWRKNIESCEAEERRMKKVWDSFPLWMLTENRQKTGRDMWTWRGGGPWKTSMDAFPAGEMSRDWVTEVKNRWIIAKARCGMSTGSKNSRQGYIQDMQSARVCVCFSWLVHLKTYFLGYRMKTPLALTFNFQFV